MAGFEGKELVRRLSWLVWQDQENFRHQLKEAVSIILFFYLLFWSTYPGTLYFSMLNTPSRERSLV